MLLGPLPSRFYFSSSVNKQQLPASRFLFCPGRAEQGVGRQSPFSLPPPLLQSRAPPGWSSSGVPRGASPAPGAEPPAAAAGSWGRRSPPSPASCFTPSSREPPAVLGAGVISAG